MHQHKGLIYIKKHMGQNNEQISIGMTIITSKTHLFSF